MSEDVENLLLTSGVDSRAVALPVDSISCGFTLTVTNFFVVDPSTALRIS